jgi:hypothetical protein
MITTLFLRPPAWQRRRFRLHWTPHSAAGARPLEQGVVMLPKAK